MWEVGRRSLFPEAEVGEGVVLRLVAARNILFLVVVGWNWMR